MESRREGNVDEVASSEVVPKTQDGVEKRRVVVLESSGAICEKCQHRKSRPTFVNELQVLSESDVLSVGLKSSGRLQVILRIGHLITWLIRGRQGVGQSPHSVLLTLGVLSAKREVPSAVGAPKKMRNI